MINPRKLTLATLLTATAWVFIATTTHAADAPKSMRGNCLNGWRGRPGMCAS